MATDQERQQAVAALLVRLREETESAVRGFVDDVVTRADADRQRALDDARRAADAAVETAVDAARKDVRAELDGVVAARLQEAETRHAARVAELEAKLAETRNEADAARNETDAARTAALAEARENAEAAQAAQAAAVADVRERADAERASAVAKVREEADAEQATMLAEVREQAAEEQARIVAGVRQDAAAEQAAALARARKTAAADQAEALSRVRREAAVAQAEAVARAQEAAVRVVGSTSAGGGAGAPDEEVRLGLDSAGPSAGAPGAGAAAEDAARVSQVLDTIRLLDDQTTLTSLLEALTEAAATYASRAALFVRVGGEMRGWRFEGFGSDSAEAGHEVLNGAGSGFLGRAIDEGRALVLTPPPGEDELDWPPAFAALPSDRSAIAVPVTVGGQPMVALYADDAQRDGPSTPAAWSDVIELLARHAGRCIEALTASRAAHAAAGGGPAGVDPEAASPGSQS